MTQTHNYTVEQFGPEDEIVTTQVRQALTITQNANTQHYTFTDANGDLIAAFSRVTRITRVKA